ncbi:hypothetical protein DL95DRAFT_449082 [Leptodontidium sp. 2 PMI_412]|nr:hypothetical protein DL95DRAFT_449082 [Leptodontidium sp. 2 PMI_412]
MSSQSDTKGNRERGNEEGNMVPGQFVPFATPTPTIPSSWNLCFGWQDSKESELGERQRNCIGILHEVDCSWMGIGNNVLLTQRQLESHSEFRILRQESCYYSSISRRGSLSFDINEQTPDRGLRSVTLHRKPLLVYFRYNILARKAIYILGNALRTTETAIWRFSDLALERGEEVHPFALHLVISQSMISIRDLNMTYDLKSLLLIEDALLDGLLNGTQSLEKFRQQTQELHELSRSMVIT